VNDGRFATPTSALDLDQLLRGLRHALWTALGAAVVVHLVVVGVDPFHQVLDTTPRPLTTRFVKRQPRLTKPLELRKVPKPRRQLLQRQVRLLSARMDQVRAAATFSTRGVLGQVTAPSVSMDQSARFASLALEPALQAELIRGARQPESKVDLALEMLDIDAMDTGRYRAMVIQDPADPQALKGFFHIARIHSAIPINSGLLGGTGAGALEVLARTLNEYTGIRTDFIGSLGFDDQRLLEVPFVTYSGFVKGYGTTMYNLTDQELESVAQYLLLGGFILGRTNWSEALEKYGGLVQGRDFRYGRIPDRHPVYSSFFDLGDNGVPLNSGGGHAQYKQSIAVSTYLSGLWIGERLAAMQYPGADGAGLNLWTGGVQMGVDTTRHLQLVVNVVVFALTQEGSMTQRLMQIVQ